MDRFEEILKESTTRINDILENKLFNYPFFNNTNYEKNIKTFKKVICDDASYLLNSPAVYFSSINTLVVNLRVINQETITVEALTTLLLHEIIHMASTNLDNLNIGYISNNGGYPKIYTEAATQYLTLKLLYGDNIEEAINNNYIYPEAVKLFSKMVDEVGEEVVFNGFFEADPNKHREELPMDRLLVWGNYILQMVNLEEQAYCDDIEKSVEDAIDKQNKNKGL